MGSKIWGTSDDGSILYKLLDPENIEGALDVMRYSFFLYESACIAVDLPETPAAQKELEELCLNTARDGVTVIAIDSTIGKVVGAAFNKLQVKNNPSESNYFQNFAANCKYGSSRGVLQFMIDADASFDLFEHCNVDCLLEIMFLATLPAYCKKGIATKLCEISYKVAQTLAGGENIKHSIEDNKLLALEPVPKIVTAIWTSHISQRIGRSLGFVEAIEISYDNFSYEGRPFSKKVDKKTPSCILAYKRV